MASGAVSSVGDVELERFWGIAENGESIEVAVMASLVDELTAGGLHSVSYEAVNQTAPSRAESACRTSGSSSPTPSSPVTALPRWRGTCWNPPSPCSPCPA